MSKLEDIKVEMIRFGLPPQNVDPLVYKFQQLFLDIVDGVDKKKYHFPNTSVPSENWIAGVALDEVRKKVEEL